MANGIILDKEMSNQSFEVNEIEQIIIKEIMICLTIFLFTKSTPQLYIYLYFILYHILKRKREIIYFSFKSFIKKFYSSLSSIRILL